ncbi:hypothetical protein E1B28_007161 [Marasmius oreades]|uniref:Protein kinase domain-containing protein n=1 Tax=Marasmius oreades TaxID=181124 RepID=A0A9P7S2F4_9AGAR|nr:uncharacterized protein E1B28_007161 [Marasmius oreades]KAG7093486.1 hypothetical protein E1B28_007161 [Marasmius oreades]
MNILHPLLNCLGQPTWIRNSNQSTDTGSYLPNLGILMRQTCTFRGEEKGPLFSGKHPRVELIEKTRWVYDPAPYVLGYYAVGANVTIVAIHPCADKQGVVVTDIVSEDLSRRKGRIRNIVRMIRLAKVLRAIDCTGVGRDMDVDMFPLIRENGQLIEFSTKKIRKHYPSANQARISFLKTIYGHLETKRVPNVDHLTKVKISDDHCYVELEPRGTDSAASSTKDVRNAVFSILTALKVLHAPEPQIFHRDIRWPNVMGRRNNPD